MAPGRDAVVNGEWRLRLAVAVAWGLVFATGAYAIVRTVQSLASPTPATTHDGAAAGALVTWGVHAGFFWRAWTVGYSGGLAAFVVFLAARDREEMAGRALGPAIAIAAALLVIQSAFWP
jgi:hypothetical protein